MRGVTCRCRFKVIGLAIRAVAFEGSNDDLILVYQLTLRIEVTDETQISH